jgi:hypothetical protein
MARRVAEAMLPERRPVTPTAEIRAPETAATATARTPEITPAAITKGAGGEYNINVKISSEVPLGSAGMDNFIEKLADVIKKDMESFSLSSILGQND